MRRKKVSKKKGIVELDRELLEYTGQESELAGAKAIQRAMRKQDAEESRVREKFMTILHARKKYHDYNEQLANITRYYIEEEEFLPSIDWRVFFDNVGVRMYIGVNGKIFQRAFRSIRQPLYDLAACRTFAVSAAALVEKQEREKPKIHLPNGFFKSK